MRIITVSVIIPGVIMISVIMLSDVIKTAIMMSIVMLNVILLNVSSWVCHSDDYYNAECFYAQLRFIMIITSVL